MMWRTLAVVLLSCLFALSCSRVARQPAPEALYRTGESYMWTVNDVDKALEAYQNVVDGHPESNYAADAMLRIAEIYRNRQWDDPRVMELYNRIVSGQYEGLSVGQARYSLGLYNLNIRHEPEMASKHLEAAISEFQKVLSDPDSSEWELQMARYTSGLVYQAQGDDERAVVEYQKFLDDYPDSKSGVLDAAKFAIARYHEEKAKQGYMDIAGNPDARLASPALLQLARQHRDRKEYDEAIDIYRRVASLSPGTHFEAVALSSIAGCYFERREYDKAISELRKITENSPIDDRRASAQFLIGRYSYRAGKYEQAIEALQKGMETYPDGQYFSHEQCRGLIANSRKKLDMLMLSSVTVGVYSEEDTISLQVYPLEQTLARIRSGNMGAGTDRGRLEEECLKLLEEYESRADKGKIYTAIAYIYSSKGYAPLAEDIIQQALKAAEYCEKALQYPLEVIDACRMNIYWADALKIVNYDSAGDTFAAARREIVMPYLAGLKLVLANQTATERQPPPPVNLYDHSGSEDDPVYKEMVEKHKAEVAERKRVMLQNRLIRYRSVVTQGIVHLYSRKPYATDELRQFAGKVLKDREAIREIIAEVETEIGQKAKFPTH